MGDVRATRYSFRLSLSFVQNPIAYCHQTLYSEAMSETQYSSGVNRSQVLQRMIVANIGLGVAKAFAGVVGHSSALLADAMESFSDAVWGVVTVFAIRISTRPPDSGHPYGHGKAEPLFTLFAVFFLMCTTAALGWHVVGLLRAETVTEPTLFALWFLVGVLGVKAVQFTYVRRAAIRAKSLALEAEAQHHQSDAVTSFAALVGLLLARYGPSYMAKADQVAALLAMCVVLYHLVQLAWKTFQELMDEHPQHPEIDKVITALPRTLRVPAVVEQYRLRKMGVHYYIDLHLQVPGALSVREGHGVAHQAKDLIREACPMVSDVLVHVEPMDEDV